ncbi:MAG: hypothetical protein KDA45_08890 [Planctomycetales bacterium]|nr:hypothetical protein [Planctomycetales bacterium]
MAPGFELEVCIEGGEDGCAAAEAGATRLELNCALQLDGLTPARETCRWLVEHCTLPIIAMLRPHAHGFVYSATEQLILLRECDGLLSTGVAGIACGALLAEQRLNLPWLRQVAKLCGEKELVVHRVFDQLSDQRTGLEQLIDCGVRRVLTSGGATTAEQGIERLGELVAWSAGRIEILPGGGIGSQNAGPILQQTGCRQLHGTFRRPHSTAVRPDPHVIGRVRQLMHQFLG